MKTGLGEDGAEKRELLCKVNIFQWDGNWQLKSKESSFPCCTQS